MVAKLNILIVVILLGSVFSTFSSLNAEDFDKNKIIQSTRTMDVVTARVMVKNLAKKIDLQINEIAKLKSENAALKQKIKELESKRTQQNTSQQNTNTPIKTSGGVRNAKWGMSKSEVIKSEGRKPDATGQDIMDYDIAVSGIKGSVQYQFINGQLVKAFYRFYPRHVGANQYIADYQTISDALSHKYGKAKLEPIWTDDLYADRPQDYGRAITVGHLTLSTEWKLSDTEIMHWMKGDNFNVTMGIDYRSKAHAHLIEKQKQEEARNNTDI